MIPTVRSGAQSASRKSQLHADNQRHQPKDHAMKKLLFALLPTIISRVLQARKAKQARAAGQTRRPPRNRY